MFGRKKIAMLVAEFLGTGVLTLVVLAVQRSTIGIPYFVAIAAGLAVGTLSLLLAKSSGAHFNPAVTFGAATARKINPLVALLYIIVQLFGGWVAYLLYTYFVNSSFQPIGGSHATFRLFLAESMGAFVFVFGWAAIASQKLSSALAGAALTLGVLIASIAALGLVNPAVAVGTRAWAGLNGTMGLVVYALGPIVGGLVGYNLYDLLFGESAWFASNRKVAIAASSASASAPAKKPAARKTAARKSTAKKRK